MSDNNKPPKKTKGKCKIPLQQISNKKSLYVTFSKRKAGLFKKSALLCSTFPNQLEMAAIVFSPTGKLSCFGNPNPDTVITRFLSQQGIDINNFNGGGCDDVVVNNMEQEETCKNNKGFWWDDVNVEDLNLEQLKEFKSSLEQVKNLAFQKAIDGFTAGC